VLTLPSKGGRIAVAASAILLVALLVLVALLKIEVPGR